MLIKSITRQHPERVRFVNEDYGDSRLAKKFGLTRYPAVFVDDVLIARPKDFGFYGKKGSQGQGRYTPWRDAKSHERFQADLTRILDLALRGQLDQMAKVRVGENDKQLERLPEFTEKDLAGRSIGSKDLIGQVVIVEFWASWCPPCRQSLEDLAGLQRAVGDGLAVVAVAIESKEEDVRRLAGALDLPFPVVMGSAELAMAFGDIIAVPTILVFDGDGKMAAIFHGARDDLPTRLEALVRRIVK